MGTAANIQLGIGDLYLKEYQAGQYESGFSAVGFHTEKGAVFAYKGEMKKIKCGNQIGIVKTFCVGEEAELELALREFTAENAVKAMGLSEDDIDDAGGIKSFYVGGSTAANYFSAKFHTDFDVAGLSAELIIFKGQFQRDVKLELKPEEPVEVPWKIEALADDAAGDTNGKLAMLKFDYTP